MRKLVAATFGAIALSLLPGLAGEIKGTVYLPDGQPAAGAEVAVLIPGKKLVVRLHMIQDIPNKGLVTNADARGSFTLLTDSDVTDVFAVHEQGYAKVSAAALASSLKIVLQPWGRIEGSLLIGNQPQGDWWIQVDSVTPEPGVQRDISTFGVRTDAAGRFVITNVPPGDWLIGRYASKRAGPTMQSLGKTVSVAPGQTARLELGVTGRPVVGKLVVKSPISDLNWREAVLTLNGYRGYATADGTFRIEGVAAGTNELSIEVIQGAFTIPAPNTPPNRVIAEGKKIVVMPGMPPGGSTDALDLGTIELHAVKPPRIVPRL